MAERVFTEKGFLAASVDEVIKGLGISAGALYHHFPSKRSLLQGIAERSIGRLCGEMDAWLADEGVDAGGKVDRFLDAVEDRGRLRVMIDHLQPGMAREDREMHEVVVQAGLEPLTSRLEALLEQGNETGEFRVRHPRAAAVVILLLLSEFVHRAGRIGRLVPRDEFDATVRESVNRVLMRRVS